MASPIPILYVDVDDTLVRSVGGSKRLPIAHMVALVRELKERGAQLYCWSTGGAAYARASAEETGVADCFEAFLPKPHLLLDDVRLHDWRALQLHPMECAGRTADEVLELLSGGGSS